MTSRHASVQLRRTVLSSFIGNTIEFYDFLLYGLASALVFGDLFFPSLSPFAGTLASFATFGIGFIARPLGGFVFGHLGDTIGRKTTLVTTLCGMGAATFAVGLLPMYDTIGIWAPVLLVVLRFIQGFMVGGEWGGAMLMVVENAPAHRRGFFSAWPNTGGFSGQLLATGMFALMGILPDGQFQSWGWRVPFLCSAVLVGVGLWMRGRLGESDSPTMPATPSNPPCSPSCSAPRSATAAPRSAPSSARSWPVASPRSSPPRSPAAATTGSRWPRTRAPSPWSRRPPRTS